MDSKTIEEHFELEKYIINDLTFYFGGTETLALQYNRQVFRFTQDFGRHKRKISDFIQTIRDGEIQDISDVYAYIRKGYIMVSTTLDSFEIYSRGKTQKNG